MFRPSLETVTAPLFVPKSLPLSVTLVTAPLREPAKLFIPVRRLLLSVVKVTEPSIVSSMV